MTLTERFKAKGFASCSNAYIYRYGGRNTMALAERFKAKALHLARLLRIFTANGGRNTMALAERFKAKGFASCSLVAYICKFCVLEMFWYERECSRASIF